MHRISLGGTGPSTISLTESNSSARVVQWCGRLFVNTVYTLRAVESAPSNGSPNLSLDLKKTRQCFIQFPPWLTVASDSCAYLTRVEHNVVFCCSPSVSRFEICAF